MRHGHDLTDHIRRWSGSHCVLILGRCKCNPDMLASVHTIALIEIFSVQVKRAGKQKGCKRHTADRSSYRMSILCHERGHNVSTELCEKLKRYRLEMNEGYALRNNCV